MFDSTNVLSGKEGTLYAKINGNNEPMLAVKKYDATIEKNKGDVKTIGRRMTGHKTTGLNGSGSMTIYYLYPMFREMLTKYKQSGIDTYFDFVSENNDPSSAAGKQTVMLIGVNLDSTILTKLDGDSDDPLEEDVDFTFEDFDILTPFTKI